MSSNIERDITCWILQIIDRIDSADSAIENSDELILFFDVMEWFVPQVLREVHRFWKLEGFDSFDLAAARKIGPDTAEFVGLANSVNHRARVPFQIRIQIDPSSEGINWFECEVGEPGDGRGGMKLIAHGSPRFASRLKELARGDAPPIKWVYTAGFGKRR